MIDIFGSSIESNFCQIMIDFVHTSFQNNLFGFWKKLQFDRCFIQDDIESIKIIDFEWSNFINKKQVVNRED